MTKQYKCVKTCEENTKRGEQKSDDKCLHAGYYIYMLTI